MICKESPDLANSQVIRTIRCTEQNAAEFQRIVKTTPELLVLVQGLQAQGAFPGLRAMTVTINAPPHIAAQGLDAWHHIDKVSQATRPTQTPAP